MRGLEWREQYIGCSYGMRLGDSLNKSSPQETVWLFQNMKSKDDLDNLDDSNDARCEVLATDFNDPSMLMDHPWGAEKLTDFAKIQSKWHDSNQYWPWWGLDERDMEK
jgi:hypothetical protein